MSGQQRIINNKIRRDNKMAGDLQKLINRMIYWCRDVSLGYDQSNRLDFRDGGETDCSALVIHALQEAGFDTGAASYTGNMRTNLVSKGWKVVTNNGNPQDGDILLNDVHHVAVYIGNGQLAQASIDERGKATGGQGGDQTGHETNIRGYYNYPWSCYLRWGGASTSSSSASVGKLAVDGYWGTESTFSYTVQAIQKALNIAGIKVKVDGYRGPETYRGLQQFYGTSPDGVVSRPSQLIYKMQKIYNTVQDGVISEPSNLIKAVQRELNISGQMKN